MRTGKLRHRITIRRVTHETTEWGDWVEKTEDIASVWASIEPLKGDEFFAAAQMQAKVSHKVTMRGLPASVRPTPRDRIIFNRRTLEIESVLDTEERGIELVLMCQERV